MLCFSFRYLDNICKNPEEEKYQKIKQSNKIFQVTLFNETDFRLLHFFLCTDFLVLHLLIHCGDAGKIPLKGFSMQAVYHKYTEKALKALKAAKL